MTTDITELAPAMKVAAEKASGGDWVKESGDGWDATCSNDDQANSGFIIAHFVGPDSEANREFVQLVNPANIRALVEALEKAQTINAAAEKLVRCKGRYHSEQNYRALAALFGVTAPDLPPLNSESRTVTVKLPPTIWYEHDDYAQEIAVLERSRVLQALIDAGIKVEADSVDADVSDRNKPGMVVAVHIDAGDFVKVKGQVYEVEETDFDDHDVTLWFVGGETLKCAAGCQIEVVSAPEEAE